MTSKDIKIALNKVSNPKKAIILKKFFKTNKGEYGFGDIFLGITVPKQRIIAKKFNKINFKEIRKLLYSKIHEERFVALIILMNQFKISKKENNKLIQEKIFDFYLNNIKQINNWDLVDLSAPKIIGEYLLENKNKRKILLELAKTNKKNNSFEWMWKKRIAIVSTLTFIKKNDFEYTLKLSKLFLNEEHDLLHKATGWTLREMGKKNENKLIEFLEENSTKMPRTMLRYSIEKFDDHTRKYYLNKK
ncbi:MAG: DNA alkylation repair protein [Candidatus ainarchaeum sp.]|nr:DNA alkylation repair protein [Candidatus ainarchaeum sp.]